VLMVMFIQMLHLDQRPAGRGIFPSRPVPSRDGTKKKESRAGWDGTGQRLKLCGTGRDSMTVPSVPPIDILCYIEIADKS
jgi:hypothetical protein